MLIAFDVTFGNDFDVIVDEDFPDDRFSVMEDQETDVSDRIGSVSGECEVEIVGESSFFEPHTAEHVAGRDSGIGVEDFRGFFHLLGGLIEDPSLSGIIESQNLSAHLIKDFATCGEVVDDGEVAIEVSDETVNVVVTVSVEDFGEFGF